jgi:hypothetical protein
MLQARGEGRSTTDLSAHGDVLVRNGVREVGHAPTRRGRPDFLGAHKLADVRRTRASVLLLGLLVLVQLGGSRTSWAWTLGGHCLIALDALSVLPPPLREALAPHASVLLAGLLEPDFNRVVSHKIHIIALRPTPPPPRSGAADAFKRFATNAEEMLRLGRGLDEMSFPLGQATRFVQDLNQPLHAAWGETRAEHNEIEAKMLYRSWQKDHTYRGFMLVKNYSCFAYEIAQTSSEIAWDQAVNDTANLWQSILWRALGPEPASQLYGIPVPVKEIGSDRSADQAHQRDITPVTPSPDPRCL